MIFEFNVIHVHVMLRLLGKDASPHPPLSPPRSKDHQTFFSEGWFITRLTAGCELRTYIQVFKISIDLNLAQ